MRGAARIGNAFGIDPVLVLAERDQIRTAIREAALHVVQQDQVDLHNAMFGGDS